jgi:colanic acid/amylovoran/stewartan biosynthesis glycosyltransferase WcaL/AmsK/CpsK
MADAIFDVQEPEIVRPAIKFAFIPFDRTMIEDRLFRIITAGDLVWKKGYEQALLAIRILVDRKIPVRFEIFGEGSEYQSILFAIHDMDLSHHVQLNGRISHAELRNKFQQADVFFLSSFNEDTPIEVLEAMTCGLPVVSTASRRVEEIITSGVEGLIVPVMEPQAAADALESLWETPELRSKMGASAKAKVLQREGV